MIQSADLHDSLIHYAEVTLTAAQIIDLADTPVTIVAAPGAGKLLEFVSAVLILNHSGTGFTESADNLGFYYDTESGALLSEIVECTGFIDQTADTVTFAVPNGGAATAIAAASAAVNKPIVLANPDGDFADGGTTTSTLLVRCMYRVHSTGL